MGELAYLQSIPEVAALLDGADVIDAKHIVAPLTLREFLAGVANYQPGWVTALYRVRGGFVRLLGMRQEGIPEPPRLRPEDVSFEPGGKALFTCKQAEEDRYWIGGEEDRHLNFNVAFVVEPLAEGRNRLYLLTVVYYNHWTGRVYFAVIAPFHHLITRLMLRRLVG
ncbi:MAG: DUF2867 domain-containing protein [Anaerolineae bacterium]|nr:DUF2867 domain-containing protein [Anaerolineae bacterium]